MSDPRVLLLACDRWSSVCRVPVELKKAGFEVATLAHSKDPLHLSRTPVKRYGLNTLEQSAWLKTIETAIQEFQPDAVVTCDEGAIRQLAQAHQTTKIAAVKTCLHRSAGPLNVQLQLANKHWLGEFARNEGLPIPEQCLIKNLAEIKSKLQKFSLPLILKHPNGVAGQQVAVCHTIDEADFILTGWLKKTPVIIQEYLEGITAMTTAVAWEGKLLETQSFIKSACYPTATGPSARVRFIEHQAMESVVEQIVKKTQVSGMLSFDFQLIGDLSHPESAAPKLLECNPRITPPCHLGTVTGRNLFSALRCKIKQEHYERGILQASEIALFPKELKRDPTSPWLVRGYHDVPWDHPELVAFLLGLTKNQAPRSSPLSSS